MKFETGYESGDNKKNMRQVRARKKGTKHVGVIREEDLVEVPVGCVMGKMRDYYLVDEDIGDEARISGGG